MRRRLVLVLAAVLAALGSFGAVAAQASPTDDVQPPSVSATTSGYWACIAVDHVELGACLGNPLPDPSGLPSARQVVSDATGVRV